MHQNVYIIPSSHKIHSDFITKANIFKERKKEREREESQQMQLHKWNYHNITRISVFSVKNTKHKQRKMQNQTQVCNSHTHKHTHTKHTNIYTYTERGSHLFQVTHIVLLYIDIQTHIRTCWHTYVNSQAHKWQSYPLK